MTSKSIRKLTKGTLYERVESLAPGTVFQVFHGAPWLRTDDGVLDLNIYSHYEASPIPTIWRGDTYSPWSVRVIYEED